MNAQEMWSRYKEESGIQHDNYSAWAFGAEPDKLAELVKKGIKTATCSSCRAYELENEEFPVIGEYSVILDSQGEAVCIIRTTMLYLKPFNKVSAEQAFNEGEGDRSLHYWREVHREFFTKELAALGEEFDESSELLCEEFERVY